MKMSEYYALPNKNTFSIKPIAELLDQYCGSGLEIIDLFANNSKRATITNDLNASYDTDYHMDALEFLRMFASNSIDIVLYDPPYSPRQLKEVYDSVGISLSQEDTQTQFWTNQKNEIARILKVGGLCISFGWTTCGIGMKNHFEKIEVMSICHGGMHNNTLITVEKKLAHKQNIFEFIGE